MRIEHFATNILTSDVAASRDFYRLLGYQVVFDLGWNVNLRHPDDPRYDIGLLEDDHDSIPAPLCATETDDPNRSWLCFLVSGVDAEHARLRDAGVPVLRDIEYLPWGERRCCFRAPEGTVIVLLETAEPDPEWLRDNAIPIS